MLEATVGVAGGLGIVVAGRRGGSTVRGLSLALCIVARELSRVLAGESDELVAFAALRNLDAILVGPLLDLAVAPAIEKLVAQGLLSTGC